MFIGQFNYPGRRALAPTLLAVALAAGMSAPVQASSHREAPFIATQPSVDGADFYMFRSYQPGRDQYVTMVATYNPAGQDPQGPPNYSVLDPNALYEIHVVNDGGAVENLTFQFKFQNNLDDNKLMVGGKAISIPIVQNGSADVSVPNSSALNVHEADRTRQIRWAHRDPTVRVHATSGRLSRALPE